MSKNMTGAKKKKITQKLFGVQRFKDSLIFFSNVIRNFDNSESTVQKFVQLGQSGIS